MLADSGGMETREAEFLRGARRGYAGGLVASLLVAGTGQLLLRRIPEGTNAPALVQEFGYALTGLCLLGTFLLARRGRRVLRAASNDPLELRLRAARQEYARWTMACAAGVLFGFLYWGLGGRAVERHARTYAALGPAAFLALAVRPGRWADPQVRNP